MKGKAPSNDQLSATLRAYFEGVSSRERIFRYKENFDIEGAKTEGATYGKTTRLKENGKLYLVKKSARLQELDKVEDRVTMIDKTPSRNTVLLNQYKESAEEVCAAVNFHKFIDNVIPKHKSIDIFTIFISKILGYCDQ